MISAVQLRMARAALRLSVRDLARDAGVAPTTILRIEADLSSHSSSLLAVREALERAGIIFVHRRDGNGVRLSYSADCVRSLITLAENAPKGAELDTAIQERIDRFLTTSVAWRREWRISDRAFYLRDLRDRIRAESNRASAEVRQVLTKALDYITSKSRLPR